MFKDYDNYVKKECSKIPPSLMFNGYSQINTIHGADKNLEKINQISQVSTSSGTVLKEQDLTSVIAKKIVDPFAYKIANLQNNLNQKDIKVQKAVVSDDFDSSILESLQQERDLAKYEVHKATLRNEFKNRSKADLQTLIKDLRLYLATAKDQTVSEEKRIEFVRKSITSLTQPNKEQIVDMYLKAYELIDPGLTMLYQNKNDSLSELLLTDAFKPKKQEEEEEDEGEGEEGEGEEEDVPELEEVPEYAEPKEDVKELFGAMFSQESLDKLLSTLSEQDIKLLQSGEPITGYTELSAPSVASKDSAPSFMNQPVDFTGMMFSDVN